MSYLHFVIWKASLSLERFKKNLLTSELTDAYTESKLKWSQLWKVKAEKDQVKKQGPIRCNLQIRSRSAFHQYSQSWGRVEGQ